MSQTLIRSTIKKLLNEGAFDLVLFSNINKSDVYNRFPDRVKESFAQSYFYGLLSDRRIKLLTDKQEFLKAAELYFDECQNVRDISMLSIHISKIVASRFLEALRKVVNV